MVSNFFVEGVLLPSTENELVSRSLSISDLKKLNEVSGGLLSDDDYVITDLTCLEAYL